MKKNLLIALLCIFISGLSYAQLTGIKNIPGDYATLELAISDLNAQGVGTGGVIFNIDSVYTETFSSPTAGKITATGTVANPITFQKKGVGANPAITAGIGTTTNLDGIIIIAGGDYITFDGIDLNENPANTTPTTQMEWGYAILKSSVTDGSQNITIRNSTITLNKLNTATIGIYAHNHLPSATTALTITNASGANSYLKIYNNTINNCYSGISVTGFNDVVGNAFAFYDQYNEIGKDGANTIGSFGGSTVVSYGIYTKYQNNLKIANNSIIGSVTGTGGCSGIQLDASSNASLELYGNTVKIAYSGTSGTFNGIYDNMGTTVTNNLVNIHDNTVTQCTMPSATTGSCNYFNIAHAGVPFSFHGNSATSNTYGSSSTTSIGQVVYMYLFGSNPSTLSTIDIYNNDVSNNTRLQSVPATATTMIYYGGIKGAVQNTYNNTAVNNNFVSTGPAYGYYIVNASTAKNIYGNVLNGMTNGGLSYGISLLSGVNANIYGNKIQNITSSFITTTSATIVGGIYMSAGTSFLSMNVYNNMISELYAPSATYAKAVGGIVLFAGTSTTITHGIYNNTVYLHGTGAAGFGSSAFYVHSVTIPANNPAFDLRGNIFVNNCTPGAGGLAVAFRMNFTDLSKYSNLSNNNDFWAGTPDATHVIFSDGTNNMQTLATFKNWVSPNEGVSVTENPSFLNTVTSPYDLHINTAVATQCESAGQVISTPLSLTTDFDGNSRYPNASHPVGASTPNNPDLGADEFGGLRYDITSPMIQYTPLGNAANGSARVLTATIQDASGVPTTGTGLPRLYWKINSGTWNSVQAVFVSGNSFTFTFGAGSIYNDIVSYYVVAQDLETTPNVGSYPAPGASGFSVNPPACSTPPTTPYTYTNLGAITGTFHVGVGKTYATITAAVSDLNLKTRTGPVTFLLDDATYPSETYPITITSSAGGSAVNTVTIKPNTGNNVLISGTNAHSVGTEAEGIIQIKGGQYITIDGSNSSTLGFTENQSMIIENTDYSGASSVFAIASNENAATSHIKVQNCTLQGVTSVLWATYVVSFYSSLGVIDDITLNNNNIRQGKFGVGIYGSSTVPVTNIQVTNNVIGTSDDSKAITWKGIDAQYCDNLLVEGNEVQGKPSGSFLASMCGISFYNCSNSKIKKNIVHDWILNDVTNFSIGIAFYDAGSSFGEISNNLVYNISAWGSNLSPNQGSAHGIRVDRTSNLLVAYNTVKFSGAVLSDGDDSGISPGTTSTCMYFGTTTSGVDMRNNIFNNSMTRQEDAVSPYTKTYAVACGGGNYPFTFCDYNDYFGDGFNPHVGYANITEFQSLNDWKVWSGKDWSSINADPLLTSTTNLLPQTGSAAIGVAIPLPGITDDITGITRSTQAPTMGAYELPVHPTTFNLDMSTATGFTPGTDQVYLAGNFPGVSSWNEPGTNLNLLMSQVGSTLIYTITLYLPTRAYEYKYFKNAGWSGGEYTGGSNRSATIATTTILNDVWGGSINWANLQWPGTGAIDLGGSYDVYAQAFIPNGITATPGGTYGLQAWIGYSTDNTNPDTWTNWIPAPFFGQSFDNDEFKADLGTAITTAGTYYYCSRFQYGNSNFVYGGFNGGLWDGTTHISGVLTISGPTIKSLNLKVFLEGLYAGSGAMNQAQGISGPQFGSGISDQVSVEIHNASTPFAEAYTYNNVDLHTDGTMSISTLPGNISGTYYIVVKHRNSIETWSASPIDFGIPGTISYDFSTAAGQVFGNNLKQDGTDFLIWGGDATQDGIVDGSDMAAIDNASTATLQGYNPEDVNGDGIVDGSDMAVIDNNSTSTIQVQKP